MKKLAFIATVMAFILPGTAQAGRDAEAHPWYKGKTQVHVSVQDHARRHKMSTVPAKNETRTLALKDGRKLRLKGKTAYLVSHNGNTFFAPNGEYTATNGVTYFTNDGQIIYTTGAEKTFLIEADIQDKNRDRRADDIDVEIKQLNR